MEDTIIMSEYYNSFPEWCDLVAPRVMKALESRNFEAYYCKTAAEAKEQALSFIPADHTVSWGGSLTLRELGLTDAVKEGGYKVIDRDLAETVEEYFELMRQSLLCDTYLTSVNAMSEDGEFINIDGTGNRVAAITFGPKSVIIIVGMNKISKTLSDAEFRAKNTASPLNAIRLHLNTPCVKTGACANCKGKDSCCSFLVTTRSSRIPGRIKVILVGEQLGL